jgi:hypothetical protein
MAQSLLDLGFISAEGMSPESSQGDRGDTRETRETREAKETKNTRRVVLFSKRGRYYLERNTAVTKLVVEHSIMRVGNEQRHDPLHGTVVVYSPFIVANHADTWVAVSGVGGTGGTGGAFHHSHSSNSADTAGCLADGFADLATLPTTHQEGAGRGGYGGHEGTGGNRERGVDTSNRFFNQLLRSPFMPPLGRPRLMYISGAAHSNAPAAAATAAGGKIGRPPPLSLSTARRCLGDPSLWAVRLDIMLLGVIRFVDIRISMHTSHTSYLVLESRARCATKNVTTRVSARAQFKLTRFLSPFSCPLSQVSPLTDLSSAPEAQGTSNDTHVRIPRLVPLGGGGDEGMWAMAAERFARPPFSNGADKRYEAVKAEI